MKRGITLILACLLLIAVPAMHVFACTIVAVGKNATVDGSTIITHNDDSGSADFRLWIIPAKDWEEGEARDIVLDCHNYGDYGINGDPWENPDYGKGIKMGEDPYTGHTYAYFHCRYSFMNEVGVAMGEATNSLSRRTEKGLAAYNALFADNKGWIDCWNAQDIALERAKTAREAIEVMGYLCETYGWRDPCETMDITDGNEVWVFEAYGKDMWCAVRIPDDHFFIAANSARINYIDFNDTAHENYMWCENMVPFAIANGLWKEGDDLAKFSPADIFCPSGSNLRVWRGLCLAAPSMADQFAPTANAATELPLSVKPDKLLSVQDIFEIKGDYYQGTPYDKSLYPDAGPWGNPNAHTKQRSIGVPQSCYVHIGQVKAWLPEKIRGVSWFGYGGADTTYLTPLWPAMEKLPEFYYTGSRYETFRRDSGWWTNSYVQQICEINYQYGIKLLHANRQEKMDLQYAVVDNLQEVAAQLIEAGNEEAALKMISDYAYYNAVDWHDRWLAFGDQLLATFMWGRIKFSTPRQSAWWSDIMKNAPMRDLETSPFTVPNI
jgi:dipeptidase